MAAYDFISPTAMLVYEAGINEKGEGTCSSQTYRNTIDEGFS